MPRSSDEKIDYVIQSGSFLPHLTMQENVGFVSGLLEWKKISVLERTSF